MADPTLTRNMPPLAFRASFKPGSVNVEARTVDITWTTGARVLRGFWDPYWEELSLDPAHVRLGRLNNGAPYLRDHGDTSFLGGGARTEHVIGVIEAGTARLAGKEGIATVRFAKAEDDPEADRIFRKVVDGILQNVSVGYRVHRLEKIEETSDGYPVFRATDWEPYEVSQVAMGADDGAGIRSAQTSQAPITNPCQFITRGLAPQKEQHVEPQETNPKAPVPADAARNDQAALAAATEKGAQAERERAASIRKAVRAAHLDEDFAEKLIADNTPVDQARSLVLEELAKRSEADPTNTQLRTEVGEDERDKRLRGMSAWLLERSGASHLFDEAKKHKRLGRQFKDVEVDGGEYRGMSLQELAGECLRRAGVNTRGMDRMTLVGRAFTHRSGGMQSTSDFALLFESTMHKILLGAYATTPDTWSRFCSRDTVSDFRPSNRYRTGSFGALDSLNEHGEFKNKAFPDGSKTQISIGTKGNIIALTRQAIINDDMGALADLGTKAGRAAALTIEKDVYALLTTNGGLGPTMGDGNPFFHASHANINATGSALSVAGLDADKVVMGSQKDPSNNEYLALRPSILVVPLGLEGEANVLNKSQYEPVDNKFQKPNKVVGLFTDIVGTPRLAGTRRYLFTDPMLVAAFTVAFLEGQGEAPVLESEQGWRVDGTEWKVRLDFKAQAFDPKGAVTNQGQ